MLHKLSKNMKVVMLSIMAALVLAGGGYYAYMITPPPMPTTPEQAIALIKSERFQRLSPSQKRDYNDRIAEVFGPLDREQRRELMKDRDNRDAGMNIMKQMMVNRAKQFALADKTEQDRIIAEDLARMAAWGGRGRGTDRDDDNADDKGGRGESDASTPPRPEPTDEEKAKRSKEMRDRIEEWVNSGNGQEWALIHEYWQAIKRAHEAKS